MRVHFKELDIEKNFDFITINSPTDSRIWSDKIHGTRSGFWSSWFPGNKLIINFTSDSGIEGYGFSIDQVQYMTSSASAFPWTDVQYDSVGLYEANPDMGDAQRRLAERLLHLPDNGMITFRENQYAVTVNGTDVPDRSYRLEFSFSPERYYNLVKDGNETLEMEVGFYNSSRPTSDSYGRPLESFNAWMKPIDPGNTSNVVNGPGSKYDDTWTNFWYPDEDDRGTYFYNTNLPLKSRYPDTLWPKLGDTINFSIGIADTQQLAPSTTYYYEIIGAKNPVTNQGVFNIRGQ